MQSNAGHAKGRQTAEPKMQRRDSRRDGALIPAVRRQLQYEARRRADTQAVDLSCA